MTLKEINYKILKLCPRKIKNNDCNQIFSRKVQIEELRDFSHSNRKQFEIDYNCILYTYKYYYNFDL